MEYGEHDGNRHTNNLDHHTEPGITSPISSPLSESSGSTLPSLESTYSTASPAKKARTRKVPTKEVVPCDSHALIALGMSPFMPGLDAISNQNRLVRNESILARHVSRLQSSHSTSESKHAQRDQDIYRILTEHASSLQNVNGKIDNTSSTCHCCTSPFPSSILSNPDFMALVEGHIEMRNTVNALITKISALKRSLENFNTELSELKGELITKQNLS